MYISCSPEVKGKIVDAANIAVPLTRLINQTLEHGSWLQKLITSII